MPFGMFRVVVVISSICSGPTPRPIAERSGGKTFAMMSAMTLIAEGLPLVLCVRRRIGATHDARLMNSDGSIRYTWNLFAQRRVDSENCKEQ